jgi:UDP-glucuronate decarboxylase
MSLNDGRVVTNFIGQALRGQPITIYGDGSQSRSFCYVDDLISGLSSLFDSPHEVNGPINLGNPVEFTMIELATMIIQLTNSNSKLVFEDLP